MHRVIYLMGKNISLTLMYCQRLPIFPNVSEQVRAVLD